MLHIRPETYCGRKVLPHALVFPDAFLTFFDERLHSVSLDLLLAVQAKLLLHFQFYRQSVGIPAGLTGNHISLHSTVSGDHILDNTGQHMADMGLAVGCGRSVVESVCFAFFAVLHAFFKDMVFFPELFDLFFTVDKIQIRIYLLIQSKLLLLLK